MTVAAAPIARCIVFERTGRWARALRREATGTVRVHEVRSLADCWEMLDRFPASFVVAELSAERVPILLARLAQWERDYPLARLAVVADRALGEYEGLLREAGAAWFATSPRELGPLAAMARRHLERAPEPELGMVERIWRRLPWGGEGD